MQPGLYRIIEPPEALRPYVRRIMHARADDEIDVVVRPAPTGFNYLGHVVSGDLSATVDGVEYAARGPFHFSGQIQSQDISVRYRGRMEHVLAEFTATGLYRMYGISGAAIHGRSTDVEAVDATLHARLVERVQQGRQEADAAERLCDCLIAHAATAGPPVYIVDKAVNLIEGARGDIRISDIAQSIGVNERTLTRQFRDIVGLPPKFYARVVQMNTVLGMLMSNDDQSLAALAQECGYFDQSHFNKAMLHFFQQAPREFLDGDNEVLKVFLAKSRILDRY